MSSEEHPLLSRLEAAFQLLGTKEPEQTRGRAELQSLIEEEGEILFHRSNAVNIHSKFLQRWIADRIQALVATDLVGAVYAVEALLPVDYCDITIRTTLFSSVLCGAVKAVTGTERNEVSELAASVWGKLLNNGCGLVNDLVEAEVSNALEYLDGGRSSRRYVACLLLQQVADHSPSNLTDKMGEVLDGVWWALRDVSATTRHAGGVALRKILSLSLHSQGSRLMCESLTTISKLLTEKQPEIVHGALIAFNSLLTVRNEEREMRATIPGVEQSFAWVLRGLEKLPAHPLVRKELLDIIPLMAEFDPKALAANYLVDIINGAAAIFRAPATDETAATRSQMFLVVGRVAAALSTRIEPFIDRVVKHIELNLTPSKKPRRDRCPAAVTCLAMLARADPQTIRPCILPMLDTLFAAPPTPAFADDIAQLCDALPEIHSLCVDRMLHAITLQLRSVPRRTAASSPNPDDTNIIVTALDALRLLKFKGDATLQFIADEVAPYLVDPVPNVRRSAVNLCANLMFGGCFVPGSPCVVDDTGCILHSGRNHINLITKVQRELIAVAVADPESDIRMSTLQLFTSRFDQTLAVHDCVRFLFPVLNDKHGNRQVALALLGRLSNRNPGSVSPMLRKVALQCIAEVEYFSNTRRQEQAMMTLSSLIEAAPRLVAPYAKSVLLCTVGKLRMPTSPPVLITAALSIISRLARHLESPADMAIVVSLKPIIVAHISDTTAQQKRQEAIRALGSIIRASRDVNIFDEFPELLETLTGTLYGAFKQPWPLRRDVLTLLGIVGAVDPAHIKSLRRSEAPRADPTAAILASAKPREDNTSQIVVAAILQTLQHPSTTEEACTHAVKALVQIFTSRTMKLSPAVAYIPLIVPEILRHVNMPGQGSRSTLLRELTHLISYFKHHIRGHLDDILLTARKHMRSDLMVVTQLLAQLRHSLNEEFKPYLPSLLPLLVQAAQQDVSERREGVTHVFTCYEQFGRLLEGQLHIVLPSVLDVLVSNASSDVRIHAANTLVSFAHQLQSITEHAARCIHGLCRVIGEEPGKGRNSKEDMSRLHIAAFHALCALVQALGDDFVKFVRTVRPQVQQRFGNGPNYVHFCQLVEDVLQGKAAPPRKPPARPVVVDEQRLPQREDAAFPALRNLLSVVERPGEDEWKQWLRQLCFELLRSSPSLALSVCTPLAQVHEPFARQLFHPAFASCYTVMAEDTKQFIITQLGAVLRNDRLPSEVLQELLNLAEYMEREEVPQPLPPQIGGNGNGNGAPDPTAGNGNGTNGNHGGSNGNGGYDNNNNKASSNSQSQFNWLFNTKTLAERSEQCNLHAKALHYLESQFRDQTAEFLRGLAVGKQICMTPSQWREFVAVCEKTIHLTNVLGQRESGNGVLSFVQRHFAALTGGNGIGAAASGSANGGGANGDSNGDYTVADAPMYEKLQWWSESLRAFRRLHKTNPQSAEYVYGMMNALDNMGNFRLLLDLWKSYQRTATKADKIKCAPLGARAAWLLQSWDDMEHATKLMSTVGYSGTTASFYNAVMATHRGDKEVAKGLIDQCRRLIDANISALFAESYDRAYRLTVGLHQLAELEEVLQFQADCASRPDGGVRTKLGVATLWEKRLVAMSSSPSEWQGTLANHSLIFTAEDELNMWLRFVTICRVSGREMMAREVLERLLGRSSIYAVLGCEQPACAAPGAAASSSGAAPVVLLPAGAAGGGSAFSPLVATLASPGAARGTPLAAMSATPLSSGVGATAIVNGASPALGVGSAFSPNSSSNINGSKDSLASATVTLKGKTSPLPGCGGRGVDVHLPPPALVLASISHEYETGKTREAQDLLNRYMAFLSNADASGVVTGGSNTVVAAAAASATASASTNAVLSDCHTQMGQWIVETNPDYATTQAIANRVLQQFKLATNLNPTCVAAWRGLALANQDLARASDGPLLDTFVAAAIQGYLRTIELQGGVDVLQDILRFLSLWFSYGGRRCVDDLVPDAINKLPVNTWLIVIPQIIARLETPEQSVTRDVHRLLRAIGKQHPQVLLFPLNVYQHGSLGVAPASDMITRRDGAASVLSAIAQMHGEQGALLVDDAKLVSRELIRIAVLWMEMVKALLDSCHESWTQTGDVEALWTAIESIVLMVSKPETPSEEQFKLEFGKTISEAANIVNDFRATRNLADLEQAWEFFRRVAAHIERTLLPSMTSLELQFVSPQLVEFGKNLRLVVPGQYVAGGQSPRVLQFVQSLKVMSSKQHPRRLNIIGDDGATYKFLLKGHEDIRQDERVMQLLGLVNTVLECYPGTAKRDLETVRFPVIPLSDNAGLIGWVDHCSTLLDVIKEHRAQHKIPLSTELMLIRSFTDNVDALRIIQRVETLEYAQENTDGMELARSMWAKAPNAEVWLDRRTHYIKMLSTMSMVGHILGLGDRHLQNLMLHQYSGKIIHIDFGDCFEVAMKRSLAPEKWPFRLTRMLVNAMEPAGIEGLFQHTSEAVMEVLREGKDSLMAMLEAFVYDPLISWRLDDESETTRAATAAAAAAVTSAVLKRDTLHGDIPESSPRNASLKHPSLKPSMRARGATMTGVRPTNQAQNSRAQQVVDIIRQKLSGLEFGVERHRATGGGQSVAVAPLLGPLKRKVRVAEPEAVRTRALPVAEQVQRLIDQATSNENLCQAYLGWCPYW